MEGQDRIIPFARDLFMSQGVRNVTMDQIAQGLGVSKKTIYQRFGNKAELIMAVAKDYLLQEQLISEDIIRQSTSAIDELFRIASWSVTSFRRVSPYLIHEVQKYYPEVWKEFEGFIKGFMLGKVRSNLQRGIAEGAFRANIHVELVARLRIMQVERSLSDDYFLLDLMDTSRVQFEIFELYLRGIASPKGMAEIDQYLQQQRSFFFDQNLSTS